MSDSKTTKQVLAQALKHLMISQPFARISVSDICSECGMSRKSFYYHFQDKYDLMNWIFDTELIGSLQFSSETDSWHLLESIFSYFYAEQSFYRNALSVQGQNCFQDYFIEVIQPFVSILVQEQFGETDDLAFLVIFYTDAFLTAIIRWLNEGTPMPPERFTAAMKRVLNGVSSESS